MINFKENLPLSLYIHIPWCVKKCPYCDFNSHELGDVLPEHDYITALIADLEHDLPLIWGRKIIALFIGGGTPSLFSPESIAKLISELRARLNFAPDIEITLEANPGTVDRNKFAEFREVGINRLSIGVQSFNDEFLNKLGRIHGRQEAINATESAHHAGFDNFNLDLMYGLPNQSSDQAMDDLQTAISLNPKHISYYQLTIEPNTRFYAQAPEHLPEDDMLWSMQEQGISLLHNNGYEQYEVSAYAKPGKQCKHNLNYWQFGDYLGIGAGAYAKITNVAHQSIQRLAKTKLPKHYIAIAGTADAISSDYFLKSEDAIFEFMLNALRLTQGIPLELFPKNSGLSLALIHDIVEHAKQQGLLDVSAEKIVPTKRGYRFLNDLISMFLPTDNNL